MVLLCSHIKVQTPAQTSLSLPGCRAAAVPLQGSDVQHPRRQPIGAAPAGRRRLAGVAAQGGEQRRRGGGPAGGGGVSVGSVRAGGRAAPPPGDAVQLQNAGAELHRRLQEPGARFQRGQSEHAQYASFILTFTSVSS